MACGTLFGAFEIPDWASTAPSRVEPAAFPGSEGFFQGGHGVRRRSRSISSCPSSFQAFGLSGAACVAREKLSAACTSSPACLNAVPKPSRAGEYCGSSFSVGAILRDGLVDLPGGLQSRGQLEVRLRVVDGRLRWLWRVAECPRSDCSCREPGRRRGTSHFRA